MFIVILVLFLSWSLQYLGFGTQRFSGEGRRAASEADVKSQTESSNAVQDNEERDALLRQVSEQKVIFGAFFLMFIFKKKAVCMCVPAHWRVCGWGVTKYIIIIRCCSLSMGNDASSQSLILSIRYVIVSYYDLFYLPLYLSYVLKIFSSHCMFSES